jgi:catalase
MVDIPVFPFKSAQTFYEQLLASEPDPAKMQALAAAHPDFVTALALIGKRSVYSGFADDTFNSLNAFRFVNETGVSTPVPLWLGFDG